MIIIMGACCTLIIYLLYKTNMSVISPVVKRVSVKWQSIWRLYIRYGSCISGKAAVYQRRQLYIREGSCISEKVTVYQI